MHPPGAIRALNTRRVCGIASSSVFRRLPVSLR